MLGRTAGACRFVYNLALEQREQWWRQYQRNTGRVISYIGQSYELTALRAEVDKDRTVDPGSGNAGGTLVYRLRQGIERFLITDINNAAAGAKSQSDIFIMFDNVSVVANQFNHIPGGSNVLYMDGHVEFIKYPGIAPVSPKMAAVVHSFEFRP